uniref:alpha/beta fold hydrolase n=1 Tax=Rhizobium mongolense TaxID=57676 RepID=UPI00160790D7
MDQHIVTPTAIIHGEDDPIFPVAHAHDLAANIPNARLVVIPGMGHELPDTLAPIIAGEILDFLEQDLCFSR